MRSEPINLNYSYFTAYADLGETLHAIDVVKELGIKYVVSVPQTITDSFEFWGCANVPDKLPASLTEIKSTPESRIGLGLNQEMVDIINKHASEFENE